jgi:hypothetical protein
VVADVFASVAKGLVSQARRNIECRHGSTPGVVGVRDEVRVVA